MKFSGRIFEAFTNNLDELGVFVRDKSVLNGRANYQFPG